MDKDTLYTVTLLSILSEKGIVPKEELQRLRTIIKVIPYLIQKGVLTEEQFLTRTTDVRLIVESCQNMLAKRPLTKEELDRLNEYKKVFPKLVEFLLAGAPVSAPGAN